jgi:tetratricopeptide (TPR) repeat protein
MIRMALFLGTRQRAEESLEFYRKAVEVAADDKQRARARLVLANAHLNRGDAAAAEQELLKAQKEAPDDAELLLAMARFFAMKGERARAMEMLELRVAAQPESVEPLLVLADFQRLQGDEKATLEALDRALKLDPDSEIALLKRAEILMEGAATDPERARQSRELLNRVLEKNPNSVRGMFTQAKFLLLEGKADEAAAKLRRVVDEEPNANAYVLLGTAYVAMKEPDLARSEFLRAIQLDQGNIAARTQLAGLYAEKGEKDLAVQEARAALERKPDDLRLIILLAGTLHGLGKDDEAREVLGRVDIEKHRTTIPQLRLQLASLHRKIGDHDKARELIEQEAKERPDDPLLVAQLALQDLAEKNPMGAIERLDEGIQKHPEAANLYELRARVRLGFTKDGIPLYPKEAESDLNAAIEKGGGKSIDPYFLLAGMYQATNRSEEAIATYEKALETKKDSPNLWLLVGMLYEKEGRSADAIHAYEEVIRIDPKHGVAMNNLAWLLTQDEKADERVLDRALHLAQQAKELLPDSPSVADTLGWVMLKRNIPSAAISLFREAIDGYDAGNPLRSLIKYHLAEAYKSNGEPERAVGELESALAESASFPDRSKAEALLRELKPS